ncbi:hypothetical protein CEE37_06195 [candidate division LCP-89 bacterium B3_LCP]|uniref:Zinc-finger domain-containing protein n=1 Tax=candidate division LCP-89 bacterium B3_LCP TaxID=2012998 RepID=A0A532V200_UNCL8|nr:MAG: hypothetical protein CEE37_06195 [candidate division LCP-89 bacterium B3_LCP]
MKCSKAQKYIPDLRTGSISNRIKKLLLKHLDRCERCQLWLETWEKVCNFSMEVSTSITGLDWEPFDRAIDQELKYNPNPGSQKPGILQALSIFIQRVTALAQNPQMRTVLAGAAAVLVVFVSGHLHFNRYDASNPMDLRLGESLTNFAEEGAIVYHSPNTETIYYSEKISLETIEGKDINFSQLKE